MGHLFGLISINRILWPFFGPRRENEEIGIQIHLQQEADGLYEAGQEGHVRGLDEGRDREWDLWGD